jgi:L-asparaginase/Glu-tRNA(Gln) amidotransferase subunit D
MTPETAFVKLSWALGHAKGEEAKKLMCVNVAGEITERSDVESFLG